MNCAIKAPSCVSCSVATGRVEDPKSNWSSLPGLTVAGREKLRPAARAGPEIYTGGTGCSPDGSRQIENIEVCFVIRLGIIIQETELKECAGRC